MRCSRLILEAGPNAVTVRFHPNLTVIAGVGRMERDSLVGELLSALAGGRSGAHLEVLDRTGRRLAVVRAGKGTPDRVVDLGTREDVTEQFLTPDGRLDLLAHCGLDLPTARKRLRVRAGDLKTAGRGDELVATLGGLDQTRLWKAAERLRDADGWLAAEAELAGATIEDAEVVQEIESRHVAFEAALARHESVRHHGMFIAVACTVASLPAALLNRMTAIPFLFVALATWVLSVVFRRRLEQARIAEEHALSQAGAQSYLGFHLQRVNGLLDGRGEQRGRLSEAADEHGKALEAWRALVGEVDVEWALAARPRIAAAAEGSHVGDDVPAAGAPDLVQALTARLTALANDPTLVDQLPVVLDEPLLGQPSATTWELLEAVRLLPGAPQLIYLTEDATVAAWAREMAATGTLAVIEPAPEEQEAPAERRPAADVVTV